MIRRPALETKINHERWLVSYSDFITLLFAFFVVMYSVSQVDEQKYRQLSQVLSDTFQPAKASPNTDGTKLEDTRNLADLEAVSKEIAAALEGAIQDRKISVEGNEHWIEIDVNANLLFSSGSAEPSADAIKIFTEVASILAPFDNVIEVSGHTDNVPINNQQFNSNWALSSARAVSVVILLSKADIAPVRLSAVGFGEFRPKATNATTEGRAQNRRVVLRVAHAVAPSQIIESEEFAEIEGEDEVLPEVPSKNEVPTPDDNTDITNTDVTVTEVKPSPDSVKPIKLEGGGLLFTSDPDTPRLQNE